MMIQYGNQMGLVMKHILCAIDETDRSTTANDLHLINNALDAGYRISVLLLHDDQDIRVALGDRVSYIILTDQGYPFSPITSHEEPGRRRLKVEFYSRTRFSYNTSTQSIKLILQEIQPDIVFVNSANLLACANAAGTIGIPAVLRVNNALSDGPFGIKHHWLRSQINKHSVRIITRSSEHAIQLLQSPRIRVIHDGISPDMIDRCDDISLEPMIETPLIAYFNTESKNDYRMIWDQLACRFPSRQMAVLSTEVSAGTQIKYSNPSCGSVCVRITGSLADRNNKSIISTQEIPLSAILKKTELLIMPDITEEGLSVLLTAAYLKIPVIAFDRAPAHEYVTDGETACLVTGESTNRLIEETITLLNDPDRVTGLGTNAKKHVLVSHNRETNIKILLAIFREIL